jgi:hypothetical protein
MDLPRWRGCTQPESDAAATQKRTARQTRLERFASAVVIAEPGLFHKHTAEQVATPLDKGEIVAFRRLPCQGFSRGRYAAHSSGSGLPSMPFLLNIILRLAACFTVSYLAYRQIGPTTMMLTLPLWGAALARPVIEGVPALLRWAGHLHLQAWEGRYYEFDGQQVRVVTIGETLWFAEPDVVAILGGTPEALRSKVGRNEYGPLGEGRLMGFPEQALSRLLNGDARPQALRFRLWMEREVIFPHREHLRRHTP